MKGNKQCKDDYIKAGGDRRQLSAVHGVSTTGLSKRISPPFVVVGGTVGKFASKGNSGAYKTEFISHISISTYHKLVHINPHKIESLHWCSCFLWICHTSIMLMLTCQGNFKWRIKHFIRSFCSFLILGSTPVWLLARAAKRHGAPSWKWKVHHRLINNSLMSLVVCLLRVGCVLSSIWHPLWVRPVQVF